MENKKVLLYTGGALLLGAVGYFVWSFFQKVEIPVGETTVVLGSDKEDDKSKDDKPKSTPVVSQNTPPRNNPFTAMLDTKFDPITTPDIYSNIKNFPLNSTSSNP
jgi:hypothetical protein